MKEPWRFRAAPVVKNAEADSTGLCMTVYLDLGFRLMAQREISLSFDAKHDFLGLISQYATEWCLAGASDPIWVTTYEEMDGVWTADVERVERDEKGNATGLKSLIDALIEQGLCTHFEDA